MQDIFVDLFMRRSKVNVEIGNLKSYLFVALKNNLLKKIAKEKKYSFQQLAENNDDIVFQADYSFQDKWIKDEITEELKERLKQAIDHLSPKQKEIIYLKFEEEMDYPGIANILGISIESRSKVEKITLEINILIEQILGERIPTRLVVLNEPYFQSISRK